MVFHLLIESSVDGAWYEPPAMHGLLMATFVGSLSTEAFPVSGRQD